MPVAFTSPAQLPPEISHPAYALHGYGFEASLYTNVVSFSRSELDNIFAECRGRDWDGYGASGISPEAYQIAKRFMETLPSGIPRPSLSVDPDGCFVFEWRTSPRKIALVSIHPDFRLDFAGVFGESRVYGSEPFFDQLPQSIENLVRRVYA